MAKDPRTDLRVTTEDLSYLDSSDSPQFVKAGAVMHVSDPLARANRDKLAPLQTTLLICRDPVSFDVDGVPFLFRQNDVVRVGHPLLAGHHRSFGEIQVTYEYPELEPAGAAG